MYVVEVTLKFTDPDQTRFALSTASQLGPFKQRRLGESLGGGRGTARDGASLRKMEAPSLVSRRKSTLISTHAAESKCSFLHSHSLQSDLM